MSPATERTEVARSIRRDLEAMRVGGNLLEVGGIPAFVVRHRGHRWSVMSSYWLDSVPLEQAITQILELVQ